MIQIKTVLFHIAVICGLICAVAKILDWYNPFMDFSRHLIWAEMAGCMTVFLFALLNFVTAFRRNLERKRACYKYSVHLHIGSQSSHRHQKFFTKN